MISCFMAEGLPPLQPPWRLIPCAEPILGARWADGPDVLRRIENLGCPGRTNQRIPRDSH